jgi:hypothetical protein
MAGKVLEQQPSSASGEGKTWKFLFSSLREHQSIFSLILL